MTPEKRFLRQATKGLSRRKRAEVQAELTSHLYERRKQLLLEGLGQAEATERVIAELGSPQKIASEMRRQEQVHPIIGTIVLGLLCILAPISIGQVIEDCFRLHVHFESAPDITEAYLKKNGYLTLNEARNTFAWNDIKISWSVYGLKVLHSNLPPFMLDGDSPNCTMPTAFQKDRLFVGELPYVPKIYIMPESIITCAAENGWPIQISPVGISLEGKPINLKLSNKEYQNPYELQNLLFEKSITLAIAPLLKKDSEKSLGELVGIRNGIRIEQGWFKRDLVDIKVNLQKDRPIMIVSKPSTELLEHKKYDSTNGKTIDMNEKYTSITYTIAWVEEGGMVKVPNYRADYQTNFPFNGTTNSEYDEWLKKSNEYNSVKDKLPPNLVPDLPTWLNPLDASDAAILIPLSTTVTDPIHLTPIMPME